MKVISYISLLLVCLTLTSCDSIFLKPREFEKEFKNFTSDSDSILSDGDFLHPIYAFIKNGKIKGLEFNSNPECGSVTRRYYLNEDEVITKIIIEKDFWSKHCGKPFDSIYVIEIPTKEIKVYTKSTNGKIIKNSNKIDNEIIDIQKYKNKLKYWHNK